MRVAQRTLAFYKYYLTYGAWLDGKRPIDWIEASLVDFNRSLGRWGVGRHIDKSYQYDYGLLYCLFHMDFYTHH